MGTIAGVGRSSKREAAAAGREAAREALAALRGAPPRLCLVFATSGYDQPALLTAVRQTLPDVPLSGCSGEGVIVGPVSEESEHVVGLMLLASDTLDFQTFLVRDYSADSTRAGAALGRQIEQVRRGDELALLLFPDGLTGNCGQLLHALGETVALPPIVGGTAGEGLTFQRTYQYHHGEVASDAVAAVLIRGRGRLELALSHGCVPIGLERRVTRADGGWMHEIDGRPAWSVFREYLHGEPEDLNTEGAIHLSVGESLPPELAAEYEPFIIHTPMGLNKETGSLFFPGGGIRTGAAIRLARRDPVRVRDSARACAERIARRSPTERPAFVFQFDCAGRGRQLFGPDAAENIVTPLQEALGVTVPWIGFHTYGEIAPIGGANHHHNFTVALCAWYDAA